MASGWPPPRTTGCIGGQFSTSGLGRKRPSTGRRFDQTLLGRYWCSLGKHQLVRVELDVAHRPGLHGRWRRILEVFEDGFERAQLVPELHFPREHREITDLALTQVDRQTAAQLLNLNARERSARRGDLVDRQQRSGNRVETRRRCRGPLSASGARVPRPRLYSSTRRAISAETGPFATKRAAWVFAPLGLYPARM